MYTFIYIYVYIYKVIPGAIYEYKYMCGKSLWGIPFKCIYSNEEQSVDKPTKECGENKGA